MAVSPGSFSTGVTAIHEVGCILLNDIIWGLLGLWRRDS